MQNDNTNFATVRIVDVHGRVHGHHGSLSYAMTVAGSPGDTIVAADGGILARHLNGAWRCAKEVGAVRGDCSREPYHSGGCLLAWWCGGPR